MRDLEDLRKTLERIDGKGYKAYRDILGSYAFEGGRIIVDHVQADPFAAPSKVRVRLDATPAGLDSDCPDNRVRRIALEDFLAREAAEAFALVEDRGGRGAPLRIDCGGQPILERTAVALAPDRIEFRVEVALPAAGRRILGRKAAALLGESLPTAIENASGATEERRRCAATSTWRRTTGISRLSWRSGGWWLSSATVRSCRGRAVPAICRWTLCGQFRLKARSRCG